MVPSRKSLTAGFGLLSLLVLAGVASAQPSESVAQASPAIRASMSFVVNLVVGGILIAVLPAYTRNALGEIRDDPGGSFIWGLGIGIGGLIAIIVLAITIIGLVVAIPGILLFVALSAAGSAVATVFLGSTVARLLSNSRPPLSLSLVIGALVTAAFSVVPLVGGLILFVVETVGLGVVGRDLYRSWS
ncbi:MULTISPECIES: hypothetical protein [Haloferax]|uniref:DUF8173 domain-containing protein n=1 Tax=Haloferax marinum TaxID=2666143 RepID=A0A6A8G235_9EURY|nr:MULTISPECIES: hypothetical protein [Haloferax]KAB1196163.1 hypothetical protein Hfx1150_01015 [Haloferax sp. CBA1150]MRW95150.1 hypothetical protein [Haloferax marinum]